MAKRSCTARLENKLQRTAVRDNGVFWHNGHPLELCEHHSTMVSRDLMGDLNCDNTHLHNSVGTELELRNKVYI